MLLQNSAERCHGAAVRAGNPRAASDVAEDTVDHFVRHRSREYNQKVGGADVLTLFDILW